MRYRYEPMAYLKYEMPLDWKLSKNQRVKLKGGRTIFNAQADKITAIGNDIRYLSISEGVEWKKQATWVILTVHKKNNRGDAHNFVDALGDAIQEGTGTDDCWFNWIIENVIDGKEIIEIEIIQEDTGI